MSAYVSSSIHNKVSHIYYGTENMPLKYGTIAQPSRHCVIYHKKRWTDALPPLMEPIEVEPTPLADMTYFCLKTVDSGLPCFI